MQSGNLALVKLKFFDLELFKTQMLLKAKLIE